MVSGSTGEEIKRAKGSEEKNQVLRWKHRSGFYASLVSRLFAFLGEQELTKKS
jgi:hypothetical protein